MSIRLLKFARGLAIAAFMGVGVWLAFWHHQDALQPACLVAIAVPWAIQAALSVIISRRQGEVRGEVKGEVAGKPDGKIADKTDGSAPL